VSHAPTKAYVERRTTEGLSKTEIMRCLKRYVARELYPHLQAITLATTTLEQQHANPANSHP
jgi:transposase